MLFIVTRDICRYGGMVYQVDNLYIMNSCCFIGINYFFVLCYIMLVYLHQSSDADKIFNTKSKQLWWYRSGHLDDSQIVKFNFMLRSREMGENFIVIQIMYKTNYTKGVNQYVNNISLPQVYNLLR